jgi:ribosomal protein S18 acetylase RimI-like enzyme
MSGTFIRNVSPEEAMLLVRLIRLMVAEMAGYGGYPPAADDSAWEKLTTGIAQELTDARFNYVFAQSRSGEIAGAGGTELVTLGGAFAPRKTAHISVLYVLPQFRRRGIGYALIAKMLEWGASCGAAECNLNVLTRNPAKALYKKNGFTEFQIKMVRPMK